MQTNAPLAVTTDTHEYSQQQVIRRNGKLASFDSSKIQIAITKAFLAVEGTHANDSHRIRDIAEQLTSEVIDALFRRITGIGTIHIEEIQDQVELALMRNGHHKIARAYVLYREAHSQQRQLQSETNVDSDSETQPIHTILSDGTQQLLNETSLKMIIHEACEGLADVDEALIFSGAMCNIYDGITAKDVGTVLVMSARALIEQEPNYTYVTARLLLDSLRQEVLSSFSSVLLAHVGQSSMTARYADYFSDYIHHAANLELLDSELTCFDLQRLGQAIKPTRDLKFTYLGLQTLYDRYFIHNDNQRLELPQAFFMRVAMGLAINEIDREARAIEFYELLSSFDFMSSTPTLFNSGTLRPQLSSCYLTTVPDNLAGIYDALKDNALLSKFAGGLGNDWTPVRGLGAKIKGTNGESQGVVPFLKVANDTAVAVNQGGKRKGAVCAYLETWHIDIEEFLDLRKNTGDERRRTHDMNSANWIPDLFMERVAEEGQWTLFSPDETPDLHDLTGVAFRERYETYEAAADRGELKTFKRLAAVTLWRKMLGQLFETGHPWMTFKDPCNIRYTNQHEGMVHSSNLCTEITLHTSEKEIAVCNLGSINLAAHVTEKGIDVDKLAHTINIAMRMLDNVIEYNYYAVPQARRSNLRHRPVGLGLMGFQEALYKLNLTYASADAVTFADHSMELVSYHAITASTNLAEERGRYASFEGSLWSQGVLPYDSLSLLKQSRGRFFDVDETTALDWASLRERVQNIGMRNSNCMAIAPTATISNICGVTQSIEPTYQNIFVKSNLSGEFTVINDQLVNDLKTLSLWDDVMVNDLKYFDGSVQRIERIPQSLKQKYATAFEIDSRWLIEAASRRQKWLDQAQSLNLYLAEPDGKALDSLYKLAWVRGLKTTYYLRTLGATHVEKSATHVVVPNEPQLCSIDDPDCEACQ